ncbi:MAG: serine hydrolase [Deltaproteobacteria bacterium]|nr:serine hydrolase [Deltaproteobacteria bacterium]
MRHAAIRKKLQRVDRALDKAIDAAEIPGAVVLARMQREGETLEHCSVRGLALSRPERIPMARETVFDLASLTKVLATTTAFMRLVEAGAVALDDPVAKVLPHFAEREKEAVTFRHLLTHSSGLKPLRDFHEPLAERERKSGERLLCTPAAKAWVIESICRSALVHAPGEAVVYGDLDFITLGAAVEQLVGKPLDEHCAETIYAPLGLTSMRFLPLAAPIGDAERRGIAATENCPIREKILWGEVHDPNAWTMGGVAGHAGLFASADDVLKFGQTLIDVWHGRSDAFPRARLAEFAAKQNIPPGSDWALGWDTPAAQGSSAGRYFSRNSIGHLGFTGTSIWIDLDAECVVVMLTNRIHLVAKRSKFALRAEIHDLVREAFAE